MNNEPPKTERVEKLSKNQIRQQKFESAMENFSTKEVPKSVPKRRNWITILVLTVAIAIGVVLIVEMSAQMGEEQKSFIDVFSSVSAQNVALAVGVLLSVILLDMLKYVVILLATTNKFHPLIGAKTALLGKYYDNITPFASGGQPMQIYYLHKKGFTGGLSGAVVMIKYFFNTTAWLLVALVCMAFNTKVLQNVANGEVILIAGWAGWGINVCLPAFLLLFVLLPKLARKLTSGVVTLGCKLKLIKNKEKVMNRAETIVQDFRSAFIIMSKRPLHLIILALCCVLEMALSFAFPYFIIRMFNGFATDNGFATIFSVMALHSYAAFAASVVPTPGNSGAMEGLFTLAFSSIAGTTLLWAVFTWRFAVYYLYIVIGVVISIVNLIRNLANSHREKVAQPTTTEQPPDQRVVEVELSKPAGDEKPQ